MNGNLEIDLLHAFVSIAETRSFTVSARRLHRVQPAVSMQVRRLEEIVGQRLFVRTTKSVRLTAAGNALLADAQEILALNARALAKLQTPVKDGLVRLGTVDYYAVRLLPNTLFQFGRVNPNVVIQLRCDNSWELMDALRAGNLDLAVVTDQTEFPGGSIVMREALVWVAARGSDLHKQDILPLALLDQNCACRTAALKALDGLGRLWRVVCSSHSYAGVIASASAGLAITPLPIFLVDEQLQVLGDAEGMPPLPTMAIALHKGQENPGRLVSRLADAITQNIGTPLASTLTRKKKSNSEQIIREPPVGVRI